MNQWWHRLTHSHIQISKKPEFGGDEIIVQFCWRRLPPRKWNAMVKQDGVITKYTPAQFEFWAKGQGLNIPN